MQPQEQRAQEISQRLVLAAQKIIYNPQVSRQLLQIIKEAGDPVRGVISAAIVVIDQLREKAKGIPQDMAYAVGPAVVMFLFELADAAKIVQVQPQMIAQARQALAQVIQGRAGSGQPAQAAPAAPAQPAAPGPGLIGAAMQGG